LGVKADTLSPTLIAQASRCLHFYFQERFGDKSRKLPESAGQKLIRERGREFETQVVSSLPHVHEPEWDLRDFHQGSHATVELMEQGVEWIHSGVLCDDQLVGIPDLLHKVPGRSKFGKFLYRPIDIKNHKKVTKQDILQVVAYSVMLEKMQGTRYPEAGIWLNSNNVETVNVDKNLPLLNTIIKQMDHVQTKTFTTDPVWCTACTDCTWLDICNKTRRETDHISLLPNGGHRTTKKLYLMGIKTVTALAKADPDTIRQKTKMSESTVQKIWLHAKAKLTKEPIEIKKSLFRTDVPIIFYDIENNDKGIFLHGLIRIARGHREEKFFFADTLEQEAQAWHDFLDYVSQDKDSIIYCWANHEKTETKKCWEKHKGNEQAYKSLTKRLKDQCKWTKEHFVLPVRSYSIKEVAPLFGFKWRTDEAGGLNCVAWYEEWLKTKNPSLKEKILEYNRDDVLAMEIIYEKLRRL